MANVVAISLWRNDFERNITPRMFELLLKSGVTRWVWVVGDSTDGTEDRLRHAAANLDEDITVVRYDTEELGEDPDRRLWRLSRTFNAGLDLVTPDDDYVLHIESDLQTPHDVVERMLATGLCPIAGWPTLAIEDPPVFYDTFVYRGLDGVKFINHPPYHSCYRPDQPFEVQSAGSCIMYHASDILAGVRCYEQGLLELCRKFRERGRRIWVDPRIPVVQPVKTWTPYAHGSA